MLQRSVQLQRSCSGSQGPGAAGVSLTVRCQSRLFMQLAYRIAAQNSVCNGLTVKSSLGSEHPNPNFNQKRGETETQALNRNRLGAEFVIVRLNSEVLRKYTLEICEIGKYDT